MKIEVKNTSGKGVGSIDLDDAVFGAEVNEHLLWEAVKWQLAKRRAGNASTKRYGEDTALAGAGFTLRGCVRSDKNQSL